MPYQAARPQEQSSQEAHTFEDFEVLLLYHKGSTWVNYQPANVCWDVTGAQDIVDASRTPKGQWILQLSRGFGVGKTAFFFSPGIHVFATRARGWKGWSTKPAGALNRWVFFGCKFERNAKKKHGQVVVSKGRVFA